MGTSKQTRWAVSIAPTAQGLAKHPSWGAWCRTPITVYSQSDLDRRVREARRALAAGDITAFHVTPL